MKKDFLRDHRAGIFIILFFILFIVFVWAWYSVKLKNIHDQLDRQFTLVTNK